VTDRLIIRGAREHNLKDVSLDLPRDSIIVFTGLSGSGKSSLAFDTIFAEGQRRYVESLSAYARQFLGQMDKPDVDSIEGLSPAISIDQKTTSKNPRSTVGTVTEIYDYLRLLWSRIGKPHCHKCGAPIAGQSAEQIVDQVMELPEGTRFMVLAPVVRGRKGEFRELFESTRKQGFIRAVVDGVLIELADPPKLNKRQNHNVSVIVDRTVVCSITPGGVRELDVEARSGTRDFSDPSKWRFLPHIGFRDPRTSAARLTSASMSAGRPYIQRDPGGSSNTFLLGAACRTANAGVSLSSARLSGGAASPVGDEYDCVVPAKVFVRVRAVFRAPTSLRRGRTPSGGTYYYAREDIREAAIAISTVLGKPIALATAHESGRARLFVGDTCGPSG
jgi:hypothetical protein